MNKLGGGGLILAAIILVILGALLQGFRLGGTSLHLWVRVPRECCGSREGERHCRCLGGNGYGHSRDRHGVGFCCRG